jgi:hypothetical protein
MAFAAVLRSPYRRRLDASRLWNAPKRSPNGPGSVVSRMWLEFEGGVIS